MLVPYNDLSVLSILSSVNIKDLSFLVYNVVSIVSEHLPPSSIGLFRDNVLSTSIALDSQRVWHAVTPVHWLDSLGLSIEYKLELLVVVDEVPDVDVVVWIVVDTSVHVHS